ncbi:hypothetical protein BGZ65_012807 [Modicella reniformis]|uniref:Alpha/beta hydrolase fold-3 domain-containing protein n=1 Tax=Modicella reniformis TaxID=1440133 RepID=A0A9P6M1F8_9FUNG|nr:hypothetical protein BGZ65_012807 [Modicella reniformis]
MGKSKLQTLYTRTGTRTITSAPEMGQESTGAGAKDTNDQAHEHRFPRPSIFRRAHLKGILYHPFDLIFLIRLVLSCLWALYRLHFIELPFHILTWFKYSTKQHPACWPWWSSVIFAVIRAGAAKCQTIGQVRFIGTLITIVLPWQMYLMEHVKVIKNVKFKVKLDALLKPERTTLEQVRADLRQKGLSDDPLNPSEGYLASMHPQGPNAPLANLPEEVGTIDRDGTYTLKGEWVEALESRDDPRPRCKTVILYFHGGAYSFCAPSSHRHMVAQLAKDVGPGTRVFAVDYRLAPEHPFPAAIHDAFAAYLYLTEPNHAALVMDGESMRDELPVDPRDIVVAGDSSGGNLAAAFMQYMIKYIQPSTMPQFVLPHATLLLSQTACHDRFVDDARLIAHRFGLENKDQLTRIEKYRDMVHVHQVLHNLFESSRVASRNLARFVERSEHLRDEKEQKTAEAQGLNVAAVSKRSYADAALRKTPVRDQSKGNDDDQQQQQEHSANEEPMMIEEKSPADGVEWVMVQQNGQESAGDEGVPLAELAQVWGSRDRNKKED